MRVCTCVCVYVCVRAHCACLTVMLCVCSRARVCCVVQCASACPHSPTAPRFNHPPHASPGIKLHSTPGIKLHSQEQVCTKRRTCGCEFWAASHKGNCHKGGNGSESGHRWPRAPKTGRRPNPGCRTSTYGLHITCLRNLGRRGVPYFPQGIDFGGPTGHQKKGVDSPESKTQIRPLEGSRVRRIAPKCADTF